MGNLIHWQDFEKIDMRIGTIINAENFEKARKPAYILEIDFGVLEIKKSSAQITAHYKAEDLIGKQIIAVVNFPKKQIANFFSECLVMGVYEQNGDVVLLSSDKKVKNEAAIKMVEMAENIEGFLGIESAREDIGISVSYWQNLEAIQRWKTHSEHQIAKSMGIKKWYKSYALRIAKVEKDNFFNK